MNKKIKSKLLLSSIIFGFVLIIGILLIVSNIPIIERIKNVTVTTFFINGFVIFLSLLQPSDSPYRLKDVLDIFMFIFMFIAPLVQYLRNSFPWWTTYLITDEKVVYANLTILIFLLFFNFFYFSSNKSIELNNKFYIKRIHTVLDVLWILSLVVSVIVISRVGLFNMFARSTNSLNIENQILVLIINHSFRSVPVIYIALSLLNYQKTGNFYKLPKFIFGTILMILVNFPTSMARFWIGSVYIGLIVIIFKRIKNSNLLKILLLGGMLIIFPIINIFRNLSVSEVANQGINLVPLTDFFLSGDFDSFSMLTRAIIVVGEQGVSLGYQLLGSLFFFIPRSVWPTKPVGSGYTIGTIFNWNFTNVSMPLIGESYLNFGIFGVILLAFVLGILFKKMDSNYFMCLNNNENNIYFNEIIFPFTLGFSFFIMRGDLLSSWSFYVGFMAPVFIIYLVNRIMK